MAQKFQNICLNGHQLKVDSSSSTDPDEFCPKCGAKVIASCQECHAPIHGWYETDGVLFIGARKANKPSYCKKCAAPFPWTTMVLESATELVALDDSLSEEDRSLIKTALPDLLVETPKTKLAEAKFKKGYGKASKFIKDSLYNLLVDVLSESVKKTIFPD